MNLLLLAFKNIILKYATVRAIEEVALIALKYGVEKTESKIDDEIYEAVFKKINNKEVNEKEDKK